MTRRIPLIPTAITVIGILVLCSLGRWQLERRAWKHDLIERLAAAPNLPPVSPEEFRAAMMGDASVQYRRASIDCRAGPKKPYDLRPGSSIGGTSGFYVVVSCRPNNRLPDIVAVAGWTKRVDAKDQTIVLDHQLTGVVIENPYGAAPDRPRFMLIPDEAFASFVSVRPISAQRVQAFAAKEHIAPGIVVGRLQHERLLPFNQLNHLKRRFQWIDH